MLNTRRAIPVSVLAPGALARLGELAHCNKLETRVAPSGQPVFEGGQHVFTPASLLAEVAVVQENDFAAVFLFRLVRVCVRVVTPAFGRGLQVCGASFAHRARRSMSRGAERCGQS